MGLLYQKRRLLVNKVKRRIASIKTTMHRLRLILSFFMMIGICYVGLMALKLPQWYINSQKLAKADPTVLKIEGNVITPDYKIINMIRQTQLPYVQVFRLDTKELENNISQLQPIKKVYVKRNWFPGRLIITIEERTPAFLLVPNLESEPNSALSTDGVLIDHDYLPLKSNFKAKKLLTYGVRDGREETWEKEKVERLIKLIKIMETYSNEEVQYIDLRNPKDAYIMLKQYLIRLGEINDTLLLRVKNIAAILPEARKIDQPIKYIDFRWDDSYYFCLEGVKEIKKPQPLEKLPDTKEEKEIKQKLKEKERNKNKEKEKEKEKPKEPAVEIPIPQAPPVPPTPPPAPIPAENIE